jgi:hypothetical protein
MYLHVVLFTPVIGFVCAERLTSVRLLAIARSRDLAFALMKETRLPLSGHDKIARSRRRTSTHQSVIFTHADWAPIRGKSIWPDRKHVFAGRDSKRAGPNTS